MIPDTGKARCPSQSLKQEHPHTDSNQEHHRGVTPCGLVGRLHVGAVIEHVGKTTESTFEYQWTFSPWKIKSWNVSLPT
jgi:hypothetical protein